MWILFIDDRDVFWWNFFVFAWKYLRSYTEGCTFVLTRLKFYSSLNKILFLPSELLFYLCVRMGFYGVNLLREYFELKYLYGK